MAVPLIFRFVPFRCTSRLVFAVWVSGGICFGWYISLPVVRRWLEQERDATFPNSGFALNGLDLGAF